MLCTTVQELITELQKYTPETKTTREVEVVHNPLYDSVDICSFELY